jgi:hypothetical protein
MNVVPIWNAGVALAIGVLLGSAVLARRGLGWRPLDVLVRALLGLALVASFTEHVVLGVALVVAIAWAVPRERAIADDVPPPLPRLALGAIAVVALVAALRPPVPLFWDESVWLSKARVACEGPLALMARATDPSSDLMPRGYPIVAAVLEASFALGDPSLSSLVAGGSALVIASFALFALLLSRGPGERASLILLAATPLVWVHLRSVQLDLPVGLLAAALFLAIERASKADPIGLPAAITAALLLGIKDEGLACAFAVAAAFFVTEGRASRASRASLIACGALALSVATFRLELFRAGSGNDDHSLGVTALGVIPDLAREALRHAVDVETWGIVPPVVLAAAVLALFRSATRNARAAALALLFTVAALALALVLGPEDVRDFALEGTLLNRLGLELLPLGAVLVPRVMLGERFSEAAPSSSGSPRSPSPRPAPS